MPCNPCEDKALAPSLGDSAEEVLGKLMLVSSFLRWCTR